MNHEQYKQQGDGIDIPVGQKHRHKISVISDKVQLILFEKLEVKENG